MTVSSVDRPVSALRQCMLEDMAMRGLRSDTQHEYIRFVRSFAAFLGQSPDTAQAEDIRRFQVHRARPGYTTHDQRLGLGAALLLHCNARESPYYLSSASGSSLACGPRWTPKTGQAAKREVSLGAAGWPEVGLVEYPEEAQS